MIKLQLNPSSNQHQNEWIITTSDEEEKVKIG